jgi:hypothetical protein
MVAYALHERALWTSTRRLTVEQWLVLISQSVNRENAKVASGCRTQQGSEAGGNSVGRADRGVEARRGAMCPLGLAGTSGI